MKRATVWQQIGCVIGMLLLPLVLVWSAIYIRFLWGAWVNGGIGITAQEAMEDDAIYQTFLELYEIAEPGATIKIGCYTVGEYHDITVYEVVAPEEQDRIIEILTTIHHTQNTRPMRIGFYETTKIVTAPSPVGDGSSVTVTITENDVLVLLREVMIEP